MSPRLRGRKAKTLSASIVIDRLKVTDVLRSLAILVVGDLFHPFDDLTVEIFLNGDMRHGGGRHRAMPSLFSLSSRFELHKALFEMADNLVGLGDASARLREGFSEHDQVVASCSQHPWFCAHDKRPR
jgi:hypothetical protein